MRRTASLILLLLIAGCGDITPPADTEPLAIVKAPPPSPPSQDRAAYAGMIRLHNQLVYLRELGEVRYLLDLKAHADAAEEHAAWHREQAVRQTNPTLRDAPAGSGTRPASSAGLAAIAQCESGGDYNAENPTSSASGKYQVLTGTWAGFGGYARASDAPPEVQEAQATQLYDGGRGSSHWAQCGG